MNEYPSEIKRELTGAIAKLACNERDPEAIRKACARMDRMREELRDKHGELNVAVELVRQGRDE